MSKKIAPVKTDDKLPALVELFQENGVSILFNPNNRDDALISLTGIYQASGAGKNKSPHDWMRTNITQEFLCAFIEMGQNRVSPGSAKDPVERSKFQKCDFHTSENSPVERAKSLNLIKVYRGIQFNGGETFAHNEIALEYAAYLSPILRIKINRAFHSSLASHSPHGQL